MADVIRRMHIMSLTVSLNIFRYCFFTWLAATNIRSQRNRYILEATKDDSKMKPSQSGNFLFLSLCIFFLPKDTFIVHATQKISAVVDVTGV